ncbi:CAP domain-containing protein [Deinococcus ruber]|uniref:SCP domain-containing protein n=1 Tax=Deinococcus ruber TaxID=1848197 RepID=A0A918F631_9DEIO|nr:CAP domain-containing protein [Deinococcus ruber]GGR12052.1 hypothetical protein GCM10008957_26140 [Deinococcus ruber]
MKAPFKVQKAVLSILPALLGVGVFTGCCGSPAPAVEYESQNMTPLATEVFTLTNAMRAQGVTCQGVAYPAAPALLEDKTLNAAAQHRADDLAQTDDFTHTPANGKTYAWWLAQVHIKTEFPQFQNDGENLGRTVTNTPQVIVNAWLTSTRGHCEPEFTSTYKDTKTAQWMPGFTRVGVGEAVSVSSGLHYWTMIFAN